MCRPLSAARRVSTASSRAFWSRVSPDHLTHIDERSEPSSEAPSHGSAPQRLRPRRHVAAPTSQVSVPRFHGRGSVTKCARACQQLDFFFALQITRVGCQRTRVREKKKGGGAGGRGQAPEVTGMPLKSQRAHREKKKRPGQATRRGRIATNFFCLSPSCEGLGATSATGGIAREFGSRASGFVGVRHPGTGRAEPNGTQTRAPRAAERQSNDPRRV